jgi:hypothetical protein
MTSSPAIGWNYAVIASFTKNEKEKSLPSKHAKN